MDHQGVHIGTGAGWAPAVPISRTPVLSSTREMCNSQWNTTDVTNEGLYDLDGDGGRDLLVVDGSEVKRWSLVSADGPGAYSAGRLTRVGNGYGAALQITYGSAKRDGSSAHQTPFPEIVVTELRNVVTADPPVAQSQEPTRFAYGDAHMRFDANADRFGFAGFGKRVAIRGLSEGRGSTGLRVRGVATIDTTMDTSAYSGLGVYTMTGEPRFTDVLDGAFDADPVEFLDTDVSADSRWHGRASRSFEHRETTLVSAPKECTDFEPYAFNSVVFVMPDGSYDWPCTKQGFAYAEIMDSWRGDAAPDVSTKNLRTRTVAEQVDMWGRPTMIRHENDVYYAYDDVCEDITYATPTTSDVRWAVHTRRFRDCDKGKSDGKIIASVRYRYDNLPEGSVSLGRVTQQIVERYDVASGDKLDEWVSATTSYDALGNVVQVTSEDQTPLIGDQNVDTAPPMATVSRTVRFENFDAFGLVARRQVSTATAAFGAQPATLVRNVVIDGVSMAAGFRRFGCSDRAWEIGLVLLPCPRVALRRVQVAV